MSRTRLNITVIILLQAGSLWGQGAAASGAWQENVGLQAQVGGVTSVAQIFDSDDFQRMLLILEDRPVAYVLDLSATSVYTIPRDSVRIGKEGDADIGRARIELLATLEQQKGVLFFTAEDGEVAVSPVPPLIGDTDLARILELKPSYAKTAKEYVPDAKAIEALKSISTDTDVCVFFGTWCILCKKIVPAFIRTMELASNQNIRVVYCGVDEDLTQPADEIKQHSVTKTPTLVVMQAGRELGRIEERCDVSVEADIAAILVPKK